MSLWEPEHLFTNSHLLAVISKVKVSASKQALDITLFLARLRLCSGCTTI